MGVVAALALAGVATYAVLALRSQPAAPKPDAVTVVGLPPRTVAVLPFENLSPDPANEYLALGMAEMVLNRLASVSELVVIARSSSFKAAEASADALETGKKLNARYLVEGGVQREGDKLRVTARLIDAQSGAQLQALHFDRMLADIFSIQDEIAEKVAGALEASLSNAAAVETRGARSANLNAYLAYLQGRALLAKYTVGGFEAAEKQFERAIALDPNFAAAYVGLADAQMFAAWRRRRHERVRAARRSSRRSHRQGARARPFPRRGVPRASELGGDEASGADRGRLSARDSSSIPATARASRGLRDFLGQQGRVGEARACLTARCLSTRSRRALTTSGRV